MLLTLLLLHSPPAMAGRRAEEAAATAARVAALEVEVAWADAAIKQLVKENRALEDALAAEQTDVSGAHRETAAALSALDSRLAIAERMLLAPPSGKRTSTDQRLAALEARLDALAAEARARPPVSRAPSTEDETAASELAERANAALAVFDSHTAFALIQQLIAEYPDTRAGKTAARMSNEVAIIGKKVSEPVVVHWYTTPARVSDKPLTLVVFWEVWCPHCQNEVPKLPDWVTRYGAQGFQVIALTRVTKTATDDRILAFIEENKLTFAIGKEDGTATTQFAVTGIPAAALIKDGVVVWRGHPARVTPEMIEKYLPGR